MTMTSPDKLGVEVTVDITGRSLVISKILAGGAAARDGRLQVGDVLLSVQPAVSAHCKAEQQAPSERTTPLQPVLTALKSASPGPWHVTIMRPGCDDVIEVEISPPFQHGQGSGGAEGACARACRAPDAGRPAEASFHQHLLKQLVQATAPHKDWQTKAARLGMPGFGGEFKEHTWEEVWAGPDDEPEEFKPRDPETGLLLQYGTVPNRSVLQDGSRLGRLSLILIFLGSGGSLCLLFHFLPLLFPVLHL